MSAISVTRRRKRLSDAARSCARSIYENLEHRILFDSTINVSANSTGSYGGADVSSVVIYDDANNNGALDFGENSTSLTTGGDNTSASGTLTIADDSHTVHLRAQIPSNEFEWGGDHSIDFTADGTEDGSSYEFAIGPISSVSGKVFEDFNGNGVQDTDDFSLSGWTVYIDNNGNGSYDSGEPTTTTDSSGNYTLTGAYLDKSVRVLPPNSSWSIDYPAASSDGGGHVVSSASETGDNFGVQGPISITGTVWNDSNDNGTQNTGENAVTGDSSWTVFDDVNENGQLDSGEPTTTVASDGTYTLNTSGSISCHHVMLIPPAEWRVTSPANDIEIIPNSACHCGTTTFASYDFGVTEKGMISGSVFEDMNAQVSPLLSNPGVSSVTMTLIDATTLSTVATTTTDSSGNYSFRNLSTGGDPYEVEASLSSPPAGFVAEATTSPSISLGNGDFQTADFALQRILPSPANVTASESVSGSSKTITVDWDDTVNGAASSYDFHVYRSTNGGAFSLVATVSSGLTSYTDSSLSTSNSYAYVVTTNDTNGNSAYSNLANPEASPAPSNLIAAAQLGSVKLSWTPDSGAPSGTTYSIYRFDGANSDNSVLVASGITTTTFTDSSVFLKHTGKRFRYELVPNYPAISGHGNGGEGSGGGVGAIIPESDQISYSQNIVLEAQVPVAGAGVAYCDEELVPVPFGLTGTVTNTSAMFGFNDSALYMDPNGGPATATFSVNNSSGHGGGGTTLDSISLNNSGTGLPTPYSKTSPLTGGFGTSTMYFHEVVSICHTTDASLQAGLGGLYIITYTYTP